jgi:hypothetical protein
VGLVLRYWEEGAEGWSSAVIEAVVLITGGRLREGVPAWWCGGCRASATAAAVVVGVRGGLAVGIRGRGGELRLAAVLLM